MAPSHPTHAPKTLAHASHSPSAQVRASNARFHRPAEPPWHSVTQKCGRTDGRTGLHEISDPRQNPKHSYPTENLKYFPLGKNFILCMTQSSIRRFEYAQVACRGRSPGSVGSKFVAIIETLHRMRSSGNIGTAVKRMVNRVHHFSVKIFMNYN